MELLDVSISELQLKQQHYKDLEKDVFNLKRLIQYGATYAAFKAGYLEKSKAVEKWQVSLRFIVYSNLETAKKLHEKYKAIAEGNHHKGTYKHFNTSISDRLSIVNEGQFKKVLEPIEVLPSQ